MTLVTERFAGCSTKQQHGKLRFPGDTVSRPFKVIGKESVFYIEDAATVLTLYRGHSKDKLATVISVPPEWWVLALDAGCSPDGGGQTDLQL